MEPDVRWREKGREVVGCGRGRGQKWLVKLSVLEGDRCWGRAVQNSVK